MVARRLNFGLGGNAFGAMSAEEKRTLRVVNLCTMRQQLWLRRRKFVATTDSNHTRPFVHLANAPPVVHVITMEAYNLVTTGLPELIQIQAR